MFKKTHPHIWLSTFAIFCWLLIHLTHYHQYIIHDSWQHIFPVIFSISRDTTCAGLPNWVNVDTGNPLIPYVLSFSVTQLFRLPTIYLMGCLQLSIIPALYLEKIHIFLCYFSFSTAMYILGRVLFTRHLSAIYLFIATLFAGLSLENFHSAQVMSELFWLPWIIICGVLYHRNSLLKQGVWYLNGGVLFLSLLALDHYPHMPILIALFGLLLYIIISPNRFFLSLKHHFPQLWPSLIIILVTGIQLLIFQKYLAEENTAFRSLVLTPNEIGETYFVQPTALISSFFPLSFLKGYGTLIESMRVLLANFGITDRRMFIYVLNGLVFYIGFIPTVLAIAFLFRPNHTKLKIWWWGFTLLFLLVSLQQSNLYHLIFHLPFFNTFRGYFLYILEAIFGFLVISGYGFDTLLTLDIKTRKTLITQSLSLTLLIATLVFLFMTYLITLAPDPTGAFRGIFTFFRTDFLLIIIGTIVLLLLGRAIKIEKWMIILTTILIISQSAYTIGVYQRLSVPLEDVLKYYQLQPTDYTKNPQPPQKHYRQECTVFFPCYLSEQDSVSLAPLAFFRNKNDVVFVPNLSVPVVKALLGLTHPIFWLSSSATIYNTKQELTQRLNQHQTDISNYLHQVVNLEPQTLPQIPPPQTNPQSRIININRTQDRIEITYQSNSPTYLNAAITYDPGWIATLNGNHLKVVRGNFNGLAIALPPGSGILTLSFRSWTSDLFFFSRYITQIVALVVVWKLIRLIPPIRF